MLYFFVTEEENIADRYLRRSNELLAGFSKDLTEEKRQKRSEGSAENLGDEIRALEKLYVKDLDARNPIQKKYVEQYIFISCFILLFGIQVGGGIITMTSSLLCLCWSHDKCIHDYRLFLSSGNS